MSCLIYLSCWFTPFRGGILSMAARSKGSFLTGEPTVAVQEGQCHQQTWVVGKPRVKHLCSALLPLPGYGNHWADASSKQHLAILTRMLQLFKHPGKMDCSCFFCPQQYEAAGKYFWKIQGCFLMWVWDLCIFFLCHTIFTRFGSVKTHFFHSLWNNVCIFLWFLSCHPEKISSSSQKKLYGVGSWATV